MRARGVLVPVLLAALWTGAESGHLRAEENVPNKAVRRALTDVIGKGGGTAPQLEYPRRYDIKELKSEYDKGENLRLSLETATEQASKNSKPVKVTRLTTFAPEGGGSTVSEWVGGRPRAVEVHRKGKGAQTYRDPALEKGAPPEKRFEKHIELGVFKELETIHTEKDDAVHTISRKDASGKFQVVRTYRVPIKTEE